MKQEILLQVDEHTCTLQEFEAANTQEEGQISEQDLAYVQGMEVGEVLMVGMVEVKRIQ